jgi:hypothetical protein
MEVIPQKASAAQNERDAKNLGKSQHSGLGPEAAPNPTRLPRTPLAPLAQLLWLFPLQLFFFFLSLLDYEASTWSNLL